MEENKTPIENAAVEDQKVEALSTPAVPQVNSKPKHSKKFKALMITLVFIGGFIIWFGIFIAPTLVKKIDPISKINQANIKACTEDCLNSKDSSCVNKCLESNGSSARITEAKVTSTLTPTASPAPTLALTSTPSIAKKVTSVPKYTPTPAGTPTLIIKVGEGANTVTLVNQTTGKTTSEGIAPPGKNYYVEPGAYRITVNEKPNYRAAYSICYSNCSLTSGTWDNDDWGTTVNVNVETGKTSGASFYYVDPNNLPWKCTGGSSKPYCL